MRNLVAGGVLQERIAGMLGITVKTLRRHFKDAIRIGQTRIDAISVNTLLAAMNAGGRDALTAAMWWQKSRMGWTEKPPLDERPADQGMRVTIELVGEPPKVIDHDDAPTPRPGFDMRKHVELVG